MAGVWGGRPSWGTLPIGAGVKLESGTTRALAWLRNRAVAKAQGAVLTSPSPPRPRLGAQWVLLPGRFCCASPRPQPFACIQAPALAPGITAAAGCISWIPTLAGTAAGAAPTSRAVAKGCGGQAARASGQSLGALPSVGAQNGGGRAGGLKGVTGQAGEAGLWAGWRSCMALPLAAWDGQDPGELLGEAGR